MRLNTAADLAAPTALRPLEAIDEISIVAAPGVGVLPGVDIDAVNTALISHCTNMEDRFAVLDGPRDVAPEAPPPAPGGGTRAPAPNAFPDLTLETIKGNLGNSDYAAVYFPWCKVADPSTKLTNPKGDGLLAVAPSGPVCGIYTRVAVHKAPANEVVRGAVDLVYPISRSVQDGLNPAGVNCIRKMNGNIRVWGARTVGGDANLDFKYVSVRRLLLYLRESIDEGTQWVVFEPNSLELWQRIKRNVTAFLLTSWRDGALFGATPAEAFYVKCDEETNPPESRELGRVICEIGVAVVKPAEFVIFRISQWAGPKG